MELCQSMHKQPTEAVRQLQQQLSIGVSLQAAANEDGRVLCETVMCVYMVGWCVTVALV